MSKFNAYRNAGFGKSYTFPDTTSVTGASGVFTVYSELGGTVLLTVDVSPSVSGSSVTVVGNSFVIAISDTDINSLPLDADTEQPAILQFDFIMTTADAEVKKIDGGLFRVWPYGSTVQDECCEITVELCCGETTIQIAPFLFSEAVLKSGGTMTGPLILSGNAVVPLQAVPKQQLDVETAARVAKDADLQSQVDAIDVLNANYTEILLPAGLDTTEPLRVFAEGQSNMTPSPGGTNGDFTIPANVTYIAPGMSAPIPFTTYAGGYFNGNNHMAMAFCLALRNSGYFPPERPIQLVIESLGGQSIVQWDGPSAPFITAGESLAALMGWETTPGSGVFKPAHVHLVSQGEADADPTTTYGPLARWVAAREAWDAARVAKGLLDSRSKRLHVEIAEWINSTVSNYPDTNRKLYVWAQADPLRRGIISAAGTLPNTYTAGDASHYSGASKDLMMRRAVDQFLAMSAFNLTPPVPFAVDSDGRPIASNKVVRVGNLGVDILTVLGGGTGYTNGGFAWLVGGDPGDPFTPNFEYRCRVQITAAAGVITALTPVIPAGDTVNGGHYATFPTSPISILPDNAGAGATFSISARATNTQQQIVSFGPQEIASLGAIIAASNVGIVITNGEVYESAKHINIWTYSQSGGRPTLYVRTTVRGPTNILVTETDTITNYLGQSLAYKKVVLYLGGVSVDNYGPDCWKVVPTTPRIIAPTASTTYTLTGMDYSCHGQPPTIIRTDTNTINLINPVDIVTNIPSEVVYQNLNGVTTFAMTDGSTGKFQTAALTPSSPQLTANTFSVSTSKTYGVLTIDGSHVICPEDRYNYRANLTIGYDAADTTLLALNAAVTKTRTIRFRTAGVDRWQWGVNAVGEGGANAGSDAFIGANSDAGSFIGNVFWAKRSSLEVGIGGTWVSGNALTVYGNLGFSVDGTYNIGATATRPKYIYTRVLIDRALRSTVANGYSVSIANDTGYHVINTAAGVLTGTVTLPAAPVDGQPIKVSWRFVTTTLTMVTGTGTIINAPTAATAGMVREWRWNATDSIWDAS